MNKGDEITIRQVSNGFVVSAPYDIRFAGPKTADVLVFQSLTGEEPQSLIEWLVKHFEMSA